jgi:hypothetical protein
MDRGRDRASTSLVDEPYRLKAAEFGSAGCRYRVSSQAPSGL